jgi:hypothetical protein
MCPKASENEKEKNQSTEVLEAWPAEDSMHR